MQWEVLLGFRLAIWTVVVTWAGKWEMTTITRIIPGPAGIVQAAKLLKIAALQKGGEDSVMSTQEYIRNFIEDVGEDEDFTKFSKKRKLGKFIAMIKSCTPNALGDITVTLKDLSSIIYGSIHYIVLTEERFGKAIIVEATLILHNVYVYSSD
ncbi:hypothetical protein Tco_0282234 [Tanacetum coccineum]